MTKAAPPQKTKYLIQKKSLIKLDQEGLQELKQEMEAAWNRLKAENIHSPECPERFYLSETEYVGFTTEEEDNQ